MRRLIATIVNVIRKTGAKLFRLRRIKALGSSRPEVESIPCSELLAEPANQVAHALDYAICATAYLLEVLSSDKSLQKSPLYTQVEELLQFRETPTEAHAFERVKRMMHWSAVGKALWYLWSNSTPQMRKELKRLASDPSDAGPHYLFYAAGELASRCCPGAAQARIQH